MELIQRGHPRLRLGHRLSDLSHTRVLVGLHIPPCQRELHLAAAETLFVYQYPAAWSISAARRIVTPTTSTSATATRINRLFAVLRRFNYSSYDLDMGLSACDGPAGYKAWRVKQHDARRPIIIASMPFTPELSMRQSAPCSARVADMGKVRLCLGFNADQDWALTSTWNRPGNLVLMLENYRSAHLGFVHVPSFGCSCHG